MGFIQQGRFDADFNFIWGGSSAAAANPQLQFFENFPGHLGASFINHSLNTLSIHAVNIPVSISFNSVVVLVCNNNTFLVRTHNYSFGLYSLTGSTLSLANSAPVSFAYSQPGVAQQSWRSFATSAIQNITPGTWYFALVPAATGDAGVDLYGNSSIAPGNAIPGGFLMGRMTVSTGAMPASIATSDMDITGSDATRQPYIIITA